MNPQTKRRNGLLWAVGSLAFLVITGTLISSYWWINRPFPGFLLYRNLVVGPDFLPQWTGSSGGMSFLDRVVAVNGKPVTTPAEVYDLVQGSPPGSLFQYTVAKKGQILQITIPSMKFSFYDWLFSFGVYLLAGLGFLATGLAPFYLRAPAPSVGPLFFMVTMIFLWFTTTYDFMTTQLLPKEIRVLAFTLTPSAGIHLGLLLTGGLRERPRQRRYLCVVYTLSILLALGYSLTFYRPLGLWQWAVRAGYGYSWLAALIFLGLLWSALKRPISQLDKSRLRVVFLGAIVGFFLPTFGAVLRAYLGWEIPHNLLLIPAVCFPLSVAYALVKYSLFDIGLVLKVGLTRGALTGALLVIYVLVVWLLSFLTGAYDKEVLGPLLFAVLVVLLFNPLLRWLEAVVGRYIYGQEYDPLQLRRDIGLLLGSLVRPEVTAEKFLKIVGERMGIGAAHLFFRPAEDSRCVAVSLGNGEAEGWRAAVDLGSLSRLYSGTRREGISRGEVEKDPAYADRRAAMLVIFQVLNAELLIPISFEKKILGFISIGGKRSGREYSADDFWLLCNLADQLALSLENGVLYEESEKAKESYRSLYDESRAMNQRLVEADRLKKEFVANISHELRTPISAILGYTEVLLDPGFRGDVYPILERLVSSGQDLSQLMDSLLDFSRMEAGTLTMTLQEVNLREILQSLEIMTRRLIKERPIRFRVQVDAPTAQLETDAKKLQQILMYLLTNALKFTERGEIALRVRGVTEADATFLEISVADTGIGISKRDQELIFEDFRQLDGSSTRKYGGTGLGLSLCRRLAQSLGGKITIDSEVGEGSVFSLMLPLRESRPVAVQGLQAV